MDTSVKIIVQNVSEMTQRRTACGAHWSQYTDALLELHKCPYAEGMEGKGSAGFLTGLRCIRHHLCVRIALTHRGDSTETQDLEVASPGWGHRCHTALRRPFTRTCLLHELHCESLWGSHSTACTRLSADGFSSPIIFPLMSRVNAILVPLGQGGDV